MILPFAAPLEIPAASLATVLPQVGTALGAPMRAAPTIAEEIAVVRLDGATLEGAKIRFAQAFSAEWRTEPDGTLILHPSKELREADRHRWIEARRATLAGHLARLSKEERGLPPFDPPTAHALDARIRESGWYDREDSLADPTPVRRLLLRLARQIRPERIVGDDPHPRTVYSLAPIAVQRPLGTSGTAAFREYVEDADLWRSIRPLPKFGPLDDPEPETPPGTPARLLLIVAPGSRRLMRLLIYDRQDRPVELAIETGEDPPLPAAPSPALPFEVFSEPERPGFSVLTVEPLTGYQSRVLLDAARRAKRSLVAAPADGLLAFETPPTGNLREWLHARESEVRTDAPDWMTVLPRAPHEARAAFFPRPRLRRAYRLLARYDRLTLAEWFEYGRQWPEWQGEIPGARFLHGVSYVPEPEPEQLGAALTPTEWRAAERGPVLLSALNPRARALAERWFYGDNWFEGHHGQPWPRFSYPWNYEPTNHPPGTPALRLEPRSEFEAWVGAGSDARKTYDYRDHIADLRIAGVRESDLPRARIFVRPEWDLRLGPRSVLLAPRGSDPWALEEYGLLQDAPAPRDDRTYGPNDFPGLPRKDGAP